LRPTLVPVLASCIALGLAACQTAKPAAEPVDGNWAADNGEFIATFNQGAFSSRLISTGETVIAGGQYTRGADGLALTWTSLAANEARSANCTFVAANKISCTPSVGQTFTMTRVV
jgi:hypothetical protein